ncbi:hypothetical protein BD779DRAFT_492758 [Infundibulicybe gibba]|nr:hypothetical protein BD779DRAFT_492758 [Infundibulicybe gibba]
MTGYSCGLVSNTRFKFYSYALYVMVHHNMHHWPDAWTLGLGTPVKLARLSGTTLFRRYYAPLGSVSYQHSIMAIFFTSVDSVLARPSPDKVACNEWLDVNSMLVAKNATVHGAWTSPRFLRSTTAQTNQAPNNHLEGSYVLLGLVTSWALGARSRQNPGFLDENLEAIRLVLFPPPERPPSDLRPDYSGHD